MDDYPDPDEEYELMYADELEMIRDEEQHEEPNVIKKKTFPAKRSLDFSSPAAKKLPRNTTDNSPSPITELPLTPTVPPIEDPTPVTSNVTSSKRTVDDLFGDVGDIDFDEIELPSKRQKTDEENDMDLINKILEGRKLKQMLLEPKNRSSGDRSNYNVQENISMDIPRWPFIPVTNSDGDRMYVKIESEDAWEKSLDMAPEQQSLHASYAKTWEEARKILETKQQELILSEGQSQPLPEMNMEENSSLLWVEKYRPQSYVDLLSEEPVNRALLHWLHLWDKVVFKKEVKTKEPQQRSAFSKRAGQFELASAWKGKREEEPELEAGGRPRLKVALLCGPPGVGKTTLAHLLASLAGYRPVELNASDERSTEAFRTALQSATLMRSVLDADRRPNCLILDEIDGAPLPTVELLVKWCTASAGDQAGGGKKKQKTQPLKRPVIAICNDLYTNSLRPLRPVSLVVPVGGVSRSRLAARLCAVGAREGLALSPHVAAALAARARGDVRAAIQVLSFIKARAKAQLSVADVENAAIGTKDCNKSVMQALQAVFTTNDTDPTAIMKTINAAGEYDRLAEGVFENYLSARVDGRLLVACETLRWLRHQDAISGWIQRHQNYSLYAALPLCLLRCHTLLASRTPQRLKFPTQAQEMYRKRQELESITHAVWRGSCAAVASSRAALQRDLLPLLPYLLAPALRSANVQLCSENERKALRTCAGAMCEYGLQYVQRRAPDGLYAFVLEPDIHRVAFFANEDRVRPPPAIRQAIAREQQLEMIRRNEEMANRVANNTKTSLSQAMGRYSKVASMKAPAAIPNHLQRLQPKELQKTPQVHKDFFGRVVPLSQVQRTDALPDVISSSSVFYQYREGFNNAVRRNVRTRDIM